MKKMLVAFMLCGVVLLSDASRLSGQATTMIRGTISDKSGAVVPSAKVTLSNPQMGIERTTIGGPDGVYEFQQVLPGEYDLKVEAQGFRIYESKGLQLLVKTPAQVNVTLEVGARTEVVSVTAEAPILNTSDAAMGSTFSENQVRQLPLESRNVVDLLSLQAGVVYTGNRTDIDLNVDTRSGAVNGARSDQSNVMLDGVDVNDQANGYAFTSVLRMTPDSLEEFRVTTTNANADEGRSSGAQVALVSKGGSNGYHGALYEYHRNTATSANDYFIKKAELESGKPNQAPKLIRNIFGGAVGGPIKRDRAFFFANYEGRHDRQEESAVRTVPTATLRAGEILYNNVNGGITTVTPANLRAMDPNKQGPDPVMLAYFNTYPLPNDTSVGDGLNYSGFRFPGPVRNNYYTYIARLDYHLTQDGKHNLFWRGNLMNDAAAGVPFLPGRKPEETLENYSKGFVLGYIASLRPTLVNTFRWGLTRQSLATLGDSNQPWIYFRGLDQGVTRTHSFTLPVHNFADDVSWSRGRHTIQFGSNIRVIDNPRFSLGNSFSDGVTNASWLDTSGIANTGSPFDPAATANSALGLPAVDSSFSNSYDFPTIALIGVVSEVDATYNYDRSGNLFAQGAPVRRHFATRAYDFYGQDSFRLKPNLTVNFGLRYQLASPPSEVTGLQVAPTFSLGQWFLQRGVNGAKGIASNQDPLIQFGLGGPANGKIGMYGWDYKDFAPRLSFAYTPRPSSDFLKRLVGEGDKTVIRAGFGMAYDHFGEGLLNSFDQSGSFGLSTTLSNPAGVQSVDCAPRVANLNTIPTNGCLSTGVSGGTIFIPAPKGGFPQTPPNSLSNGGFAIAWGMDDTLKTPYAYLLDFSVSRELSRSFSIEAGYVAHLAHRLLVQEDLASPLNLVDKTSGIDYFSAASRLAQLGDAGVAVSSITPAVVGPTAAYWTNLFPALSGMTYRACGTTVTNCSALQMAYDVYRHYLHNETTALFVLDLPGILCANGCSALGPFSYFNAQYSSLYAWRSISNSNFNALEVTARKRLTHGVQFDLNYTWSKSIDLSSDAERISPWGGLGGQVINAWSHKQLRAVSDFNAVHQFNSNWVAELPFGRGRAFRHDARGLAQALIGGWQTTGIFRITSGFPVNVFNGFEWPTNWQLGGNAMLNGPAPKTTTVKSGLGDVLMFNDPTQALNAFRFGRPGESGLRNIIRGDGFLSWDAGLAKRWQVPGFEGQSIQFRWDVFNVPNWNRFNVQSNPPEIDLSTQFGKYTGLLTNARVMQFALRYEF